MAHFFYFGGRRSLDSPIRQKSTNLFDLFVCVDRSVEFESLGARAGYEAERFGVCLKNGKQIVRERQYAGSLGCNGGGAWHNRTDNVVQQ
jgi:hypothetical protein